MLEQAVTDKGLPQNAEAERAVLGSILLDPAAISHVVPILAQDDFYSDKHQRIFRGMLDLFERSSEIDLLTLKEELNAGGTETVDAAYLSWLIDGVPDIGNVAHYARIVKDKAVLRQAIRIGQRIVRDGLSGKDAGTLLADASAEILT